MKHLIRKSLLFICTASAAMPVFAQKLGDVSDGSRAVPVHVMDLLDENGTKISPTDKPLMPFSTKRTCGECHDYETISKGWHFNYTSEDVDPGRVGQPWIYVDAATGTQLPLSYRDWPGCFNPSDIGISTYLFTKMFGSHFPGGGAGEIEPDEPEEIMRSFVSGPMEINCLACHDCESAYDQAEFGDQIARENFRWAAAAASGVGEAVGSARDMPETYDPFMPDVIEDPSKIAPAISYDSSRFLNRNKVFFDIKRQVPAQKCYFCHTNKYTGDEKGHRWHIDQDVHLQSGISCVDCHRNGLDHMISRGGENPAEKAAHRATLTCAGCHQGTESQTPSAGRLGAPNPAHKGIPPVHFDKLSCTACHSGPWPQSQTTMVKTSRAHGLGLRDSNKSDDVLPHIITPVFTKADDGKIYPARLIWPSYWAIMKEPPAADAGDGDFKISPQATISPLPIDTLADVVADALKLAPDADGNWSQFDDDRLVKGLTALSKIDDLGGSPVYVSGGKVYSLDRGALTSQESSLADPYIWPFAHDVRPATQALGVNGCGDCHSSDSGFFFASVSADGPIRLSSLPKLTMTDFQKLDKTYTMLFAKSFMFRVMLKIVSLICVGLTAAVLAWYGLRALGRALNFASEDDKDW